MAAPDICLAGTPVLRKVECEISNKQQLTKVGGIRHYTKKQNKIRIVFFQHSKIDWKKQEQKHVKNTNLYTLRVDKTKHNRIAWAKTSAYSLKNAPKKKKNMLEIRRFLQVYIYNTKSFE